RRRHTRLQGDWSSDVCSSDLKAEEKEKKNAVPPNAEKKEPEAEERPPAAEKPEEARVKASPVARRIAAEFGVDLSNVKGTGPEEIGRASCRERARLSGLGVR